MPGAVPVSNTPKTVLKVVPAGSLLQPFDEVEKAFEAQHPDVDVQVEGHGSIQAIRQVTDLHRPVDVVAVADASLIPDLMFRTDPTTGENFTDTYTPFATNAMVIAFTNKSKYADEITPENWYQVLSRPDVRWGSPTRCSTLPATARSWSPCSLTGTTGIPRSFRFSSAVTSLPRWRYRISGGIETVTASGSAPSIG